MTSSIHFFKTKDEYGAFSNFSRYAIELDGYIWPTTEHYYQAQKFAPDHALMTKVREAEGPGVAAHIGRSPELPLRPDWESVKEAVMSRALLAKFTQHEALYTLLLSTGNSIIVERSHKDKYWADGGDGTGLNRLGVLLMDLRAILMVEDGVSLDS